MAFVASVAQWVEGARPRTLPNAVAPVIAGTGAAAWLDGAVWWKALLALVVAVAMIVGVNYANDYSDGIRGTDDVRAGPLRLVGSRLATPRSVLTAAVVSFGVAAAAGAGAGRGQRAVADRRRRPVHRGRVALHRRLEAVRVSGAWRSRGVRVLRSGRGARHAVHAGGPGRLGRAGARRWPSGRCRRRCWWPTICATFRPTGKPRRSRWRCDSATPAPGCCIKGCWRWPW